MPEGDARTRYQWIFAWYVGDQNQRRPVSKWKITDNLANIKPKGFKLTKMDLDGAMEWAIDKGQARLALEQVKRGQAYDLHPLQEPKY